MTRWQHTLLASAVCLSAALSAAPARADTANFELNGKIYTKWLYKNDASRGCLSLSNPFWRDNIGGGNGVCSEFELNIKGRVSKYVVAGVRVKSRFGALWQDWWENGDVRWDYPNDNLFHENTSGESLGANHAQYMKLRGAYIRAALPIPSVRWVHIGASDFSMFNEWTIGKSRYIDRDNGHGVFIEGDFGNGIVSYHTAAIALPKLYVGPRWNTGLKDADPLAGFWGQDWAYALKLGSRPFDSIEALEGMSFTSITTYIHDWEADRNDPDLTGDAARLDDRDRAVDLEPRFQGLNTTFQMQWSPVWAEWLNMSGLFAYSYNKVNHEYATNAVQNDQGFSPVLYTRDADGNPRPSTDFSGTARFEFFDPFEIGLSLKVEYFNIGEEYNALFGSRREADVLLTDGIIPSGFISGGQLPTLNLANEFVDFDEPWFESIIGWHGATGILEWVSGGQTVSAEGTYVTYNTNAQGRDVDNQYPDFLYTDGFTDPQSFTADFDYANVFDRGRDPRSVYAEFKDRQTIIAVFKGDHLLPIGNNFRVGWKLKGVFDRDDRNNSDLTSSEDPNADLASVCFGQQDDMGNPVRRKDCDDYRGRLLLGYLALSYQVTDELKTTLGYEYQNWNEDNRSGTQQQGFTNYLTTKHTGRFVANYNFGGLTFSYLLEYFHKDQERLAGNQQWRVWRSKATVEVGW